MTVSTVTYQPHPMPITISTVANATTATAALSRGGYPPGCTMTGSDVDFLNGCSAAMPTEPLFAALVALIGANGSITVNWS